MTLAALSHINQAWSDGSHSLFGVFKGLSGAEEKDSVV